MFRFKPLPALRLHATSRRPSRATAVKAMGGRPVQRGGGQADRPRLRIERPAQVPPEAIRKGARRRAGAIAALTAVFVLGLFEPALAQNVEGLLQNVVDLLTGATARLLAIIAVIVVGILWMFGLFDLRRAAIVVLGIIVVFGAAEIVNMLTGA